MRIFAVKTFDEKATSAVFEVRFPAPTFQKPIGNSEVTNLANDGVATFDSRDFIEHKFDLKHLIRTICTSKTYQLSSTPNDVNADDRRNFARTINTDAFRSLIQADLAILHGYPNAFVRARDLGHFLFGKGPPQRDRGDF